MTFKFKAGSLYGNTIFMYILCVKKESKLAFQSLSAYENFGII